MVSTEDSPPLFQNHKNRTSAHCRRKQHCNNAIRFTGYGWKSACGSLQCCNFSEQNISYTTFSNNSWVIITKSKIYDYFCLKNTVKYRALTGCSFILVWSTVLTKNDNWCLFKWVTVIGGTCNWTHLSVNRSITAASCFLHFSEWDVSKYDRNFRNN